MTSIISYGAYVPLPPLGPETRIKVPLKSGRYYDEDSMTMAVAQRSTAWAILTAALLMVCTSSTTTI